MRWRWIPPSIWRRPNSQSSSRNAPTATSRSRSFPNSGLGTGQQALNLLRGGTIEIVQSGSTTFNGLVGETAALELPFLFRDCRACLPRARRQGRPEPARQVGPIRHPGTRLPRERLARGNQQPAPGSLGRGHQGLEDPYHPQPLSHPGLPAPGRKPGAAGLCRAVFRARDWRRRCSGAPAPDLVGGQVLRGPEVSQPHPAMPIHPSSS